MSLLELGPRDSAVLKREVISVAEPYWVVEELSTASELIFGLVSV